MRRRAYVLDGRTVRGGAVGVSFVDSPNPSVKMGLTPSVSAQPSAHHDLFFLFTTYSILFLKNNHNIH
jgi:hypothetical protein